MSLVVISGAFYQIGGQDLRVPQLHVLLLSGQVTLFGLASRLLALGLVLLPAAVVQLWDPTLNFITLIRGHLKCLCAAHLYILKNYFKNSV